MEEQVIEKKEAKKQKNMPLFILKIVGNVLFYLIIVALLLFSIMNIRAGNRTDGYPNIFGKGFLSVQTNSMKGDREDSFEAGDLIIVSVFKEEDANELKVGDVITFYDPTANFNKGGLNSHRIVLINRTSDDNQTGDVTSVMVQGDKSMKERNWVYNQDPDHSTQESIQKDNDCIQSGDVQPVSVKDIKGVMTSIWHGAGKTMDNIQKYWLFIFVLPVLLFLIFEVFMVVKNVMALKNEKQKSKVNPDEVIDIEAQKEALRAQILAELKAEQEKLAVSSEEPAAEPEATEEAVPEEPVIVAEPIQEAPAEEKPVEEAPEVEEPVAEAEEPVEEAPEVEEPVAEAEESVEETPEVEEPVAEAEESVEETPEVEEPVAEAEESVEEAPEVEEPVAEAEEPVEEAPVVEEPVEEPVQKEEKPKKTTTRKTTSTGTKKTSTAKKSSTGTKATAETAKKTTTTKKASTGTTKKSTSGASAKKTTSTGTKKTSTAKKSSTGTKATAGTTKKTTTTKKAGTGTKKTTETAKKPTTKKKSTGVAKEKGE